MPYYMGIGKHRKIVAGNHRDHIPPYTCDDMFNFWKSLLSLRFSPFSSALHKISELQVY